MSQRIRDIKRIAQVLLYMGALYFCPVVRKKSGSSHSAQLRAVEAGLNVTSQADQSPFKSLFGRVLGTLPLSVCGVCGPGVDARFSYEFHDSAIEYGVKPKAENPAALRKNRYEERSQKAGFDLLKLTLNLARGNLEQNFVRP